MERICKTKRGDQKCIRNLRPESKTPLKLLCEDGRKILNSILKKCTMTASIGVIWIAIAVEFSENGR
jgi:hypothetical protein